MQSCHPDETQPELAAAQLTPGLPQVPSPSGMPALPLAAPPVAPTATAAESVAALERVTGASGDLAYAVRDVRAILKARDAESRGDHAGAAAQWFEALGVAQGRFGKLALDGWLKAYTRNLGKPSDKVILARLIMAETQSGAVSPYMRFRGLTTDAAIMPVLKSTVPEWLVDADSGAGTGTSVATETGGEPPATQGLPPSDPLLIRSAARSCAVHQEALATWHTWLGSLADDERAYWDGLVLQACGSATDALDHLAAAYPKLAANEATQALALEAAGRVAALQRANDRRTDAASTYTDLVALWAKPGVTSRSMGMEPMALALRRIDETLWASRYRAMVGDYESGKIYAHQALNLIGNAYAMKPGPSHGGKEQLAGFTAEAYHALAFRIAVEKREFESALALDLLALQTPDLSRDWQEKLSWYGGLYDYLGGHFDSARKRWEGLLKHTHDDTLRSSLYFWLAKAAEKLGRRSEARDYLAALVDEYPLSYYATVAPAQSGFGGGNATWAATFGEPQALAARLGDKRDFGLAKLRQGRDLGPLLSRAEILTVAALGDLAQAAVDELEGAMGTELPLETNPGAYVYLTRLQFSTGYYLKAISLTTRLSHTVHDFWRQWPEQVLIYFPRPYLDDYRRNADVNSLEPALLLAISRQESGFSPGVRSNVNAVGLMQLIHPTARRFAAELGMDTSDIDGTLRNPAANIRIGSRFLKFLSLTFKNFPPAVYGGYNAGEYAIDLWLKRRAHSDPMMFVELIPFAETREYIKSVWRNVAVYNQLSRVPEAFPALELSPLTAVGKSPVLPEASGTPAPSHI